MIVENVAPVETTCFMLAVFVWGLFLQPAVLNHCHLTVWLLIFGALRNVFLVESHATTGWGFTTMADANRVILS